MLINEKIPAVELSFSRKVLHLGNSNFLNTAGRVYQMNAGLALVMDTVQIKEKPVYCTLRDLYLLTYSKIQCKSTIHRLLILLHHPT